MSTLTEFEPFVDSTIHTFFGKLDEFAEKKERCDIAKWLQYCEFSLMPVLTTWRMYFSVLTLLETPSMSLVN